MMEETSFKRKTKVSVFDRTEEMQQTEATVKDMFSKMFSGDTDKRRRKTLENVFISSAPAAVRVGCQGGNDLN